MLRTIRSLPIITKLKNLLNRNHTADNKKNNAKQTHKMNTKTAAVIAGSAALLGSYAVYQANKTDDSESKSEDLKKPEIISHKKDFLRRLSLSTVFSKLSVLPNGKFILGDHDSLAILEFNKNSELRVQPIKATDSRVETVDARGSRVVAGLENGDIEVIDLQNSDNNMKLKTNDKIFSVVALPDLQKIICTHQWSIEAWDLKGKCILKRKIEQNENLFESNNFILNSKKGCYLLRHCYKSLELFDTTTLKILHRYEAQYIKNDDLRFDSLKVLPDGESFIASITSWENGGFPRIVKGDIQSGTLTTIAQMPKCGKVCILSEKLVLNYDPFTGSKLWDISNPEKIVSNLSFMPSTMPHLFFDTLADGRFLILGEAAFEILEFSNINKTFTAEKPLKDKLTFFAEKGGAQPAKEASPEMPSIKL